MVKNPNLKYVYQKKFRVAKINFHKNMCSERKKFMIEEQINITKVVFKSITKSNT